MGRVKSEVATMLPWRTRVGQHRSTSNQLDGTDGTDGLEVQLVSSQGYERGLVSFYLLIG